VFIDEIIAGVGGVMYHFSTPPPTTTLSINIKQYSHRFDSHVKAS